MESEKSVKLSRFSEKRPKSTTQEADEKVKSLYFKKNKKRTHTQKKKKNKATYKGSGWGENMQGPKTRSGSKQDQRPKLESWKLRGTKTSWRGASGSSKYSSELMRNKWAGEWGPKRLISHFFFFFVSGNLGAESSWTVRVKPPWTRLVFLHHCLVMVVPLLMPLEHTQAKLPPTLSPSKLCVLPVIAVKVSAVWKSFV